MQERIFRFGIAGLTFVLSILFGIWYFGGVINFIFYAKDQTIIAAVLTLVSTPALGFVISSINIHIWEFVWPKKNLFLPPRKNVKRNI